MVATQILAIDTTVTVDINGSPQLVRMCAARAGLPPLLVVQGGPGLPLLNEVRRFQRGLRLEEDFLVCYWEQRGSGVASREDASGVSMRQRIDDLREILRWLHKETGRTVKVLGISIGATIALQAIALEPDHVTSIVAVSPDLHTIHSDAAAYAFLHEQSRRPTGRRLGRQLAKLGPPPYLDPAVFQQRMRMLVDLGTIEHGRTFNAVLRETLVGLVKTYGVTGAVKALRNFNLILRAMLPELLTVDLFANPLRLSVPVHHLFGESDALIPAEFVRDARTVIQAPVSTVRLVPRAGHMLHFDQPDIVRQTLVNA